MANVRQKDAARGRSSRKPSSRTSEETKSSETLTTISVLTGFQKCSGVEQLDIASHTTSVMGSDESPYSVTLILYRISLVLSFNNRLSVFFARCLGSVDVMF